MVLYFLNHATTFKVFVPLFPPKLEDKSGRPERQMRGKYNIRYWNATIPPLAA